MSFLLSVGLIWLIAAITPGPNLFVVLGSAATSDRASAVFTVLGITTGTIIWGLAGWLGISALFAAAPTLYVLLKIVGAGYLIWMGAKMIWSARKASAWAGDDQAPKNRSLKKAYYRGLTTNLANPKTAIFVTSLFAAALPENYVWSDGALSVLIMVSISLSWYMLVALAFTTKVMTRALGKAKRALNAFAGTIFVGFGIRLAISE